MSLGPALGWVSTALLAAGLAVELLCALGLLAFPRVYERLHYAGAGSGVGALLILLAVAVHEGAGAAGVKALLLGGLLAVSGPVLVHATGRAARLREHGDWRGTGGEP